MAKSLEAGENDLIKSTDKDNSIRQILRNTVKNLRFFVGTARKVIFKSMKNPLFVRKNRDLRSGKYKKKIN